jgi:hypothetical protein
VKDYFTVGIRRALGIDSPMNQVKKTFTQDSPGDRIGAMARRDYELMKGDSWGKVGQTIRIKRPERFQVNG